MFFSGDPATRKRVDLGGRSSKEQDRQKLLEEARLERKRRNLLRKQNSAALTIQKCYRGRKAAAVARSRVREEFYHSYGRKCERLNRNCFHPDSDYLRLLLFFFDPRNANDLTILLDTCRLILHISGGGGGDAVTLFMVMHNLKKQSVVEYRVKQLAVVCIKATYENREKFEEMENLFSYATATSYLFQTVVFLLNPKQQLACNIATLLTQRKVFVLLKEISLTAKANAGGYWKDAELASLENILCLLISHVGQDPCICCDLGTGWSFISQILTIPFVWKLFPNLKEVFSTQGLCRYYIHQMAVSLRTKKLVFSSEDTVVLPNSVSLSLQNFAYLVGNFLETGAITISQPNCSFELVVDLANVTTFCLEALPFKMPLPQDVDLDSSNFDDDMEESQGSGTVLNHDLEQQVTKALDGRFVLQLVNALLGRLLIAGSVEYSLDATIALAVEAVCCFLHVAFKILPLEKLMTILAYRTDVVRVLWKFMKDCHDNKKWPLLHEQLSSIPADAPGWLLPVAVFCPVFKHMLMLVDNEEFYEQEKPLPLNDSKYLIIILRQVLWQLLWVNPISQTYTVKSANQSKQYYAENLKYRVSNAASEVLSQLQDWNNRRKFTSPSDFHADGVDESFISQAMVEGTKANDILKRAPFLIPFTSRVKIFNSQLLSTRQRNNGHGSLTRNRFRIRRDHILEDAYDLMSGFTEDDLRGLIRVTFINEFGVEEAGIDGGGIFKDFMENITRAAFDVQYGLFKETVDHLLYPNPSSGMIHEQHLQYFHFLGTLLAKAMFEGILVDIPFATFFLSKLKQKFNYLNDLPSLDPELYRHLLFLKHYQGDISDLELFFVIVNNEYGHQSEDELIPGGKNIRVTRENMIQFIHLVSNHRLNFQIRQQSSHFLRGFQKLIQKEWINMFDEHEFQLLISGSLDSLDIDDLRAHTNYAGGYHSGHYVMDMFWEVVKTFSISNQKKFLKFVTGCSRGPLLGFKYLEPWFCIQRASGSVTEESVDRLPTSATCMNLLKLPPYQNKEQLETKLLYAINADAGFDLS